MDDAQVKDNNKSRTSDSAHQYPDGGYGWGIVFSAHVNEIFFDGVAAATAVLLATLKHYFDVGAGSISLISSIGLFVIHCGAPISTSLGEKFGCRIIATIGAVLCAVGLFVSGFVDNMFALYVTIGVLTSSLYDTYQSSAVAFYIAGIYGLLASFVFFLVHAVHTFQKRHEKHQDSNMCELKNDQLQEKGFLELEDRSFQNVDQQDGSKMSCRLPLSEH